MNVFLLRFRELKERDIVIKKFQQKDFDQKNLETILNYENFKDYAILLQQNHFFGRDEYIGMFKTEHERLLSQNEIDKSELSERSRRHKSLSLRLNHFANS
jgi:hypothetical protein